MNYTGSHLRECSPKLQALLQELARIARTNSDASVRTPILAKIIRLAKEEKQGFMYITSILDMLFYQQRADEPHLTLPYASLFLREGQAILDETLPTETQPRVLRQNYLSCYSEICELYMNFYEICTEKMEKLFSVFKKNVSRYGHGCMRIYCESRLMWDIMCCDIEATKKSCKRYLALPNIDRCYVCANKHVSRALVLIGDLEGALDLSANLISGNIPQKELELYEKCQFANDYEQYLNLTLACLFGGRIDFLDQVIPLMYQAILAEGEASREALCEVIVYALSGDFTKIDAHIKDAVSEWDDVKSETPFDYMYNCLIWMAYFNLLSRSDVTRVPFPTETPLPLTSDEDGTYSIFEIAELFEQRADDIGAKFNKSRVNFDYANRKEGFQFIRV